MSFYIRSFRDEDYETMVAIHNACYPDYPETARDWRRYNGLKEEKIKWGYIVAEDEGGMLGFASFSQSSWTYHPRKFHMLTCVNPESRGRGIGKALYERVMDIMGRYDPIVIRAEVREDMDYEREWTTRRGWVVKQKEQESKLDIANFDASVFADDLTRVVEQGIEIKPYSVLLEEDPDCKRKFHDMDMEIAADIPWPDAFTPQPFEDWEKKMLQSPNFLPDLNMIAIHEGRFIGLSNFWRTEIEGRVGTGLTGVRRAYRKRGLATALKVQVIEVARQAGYDHTLTWNEENNKGMLGINIRLGFKFRPAWLEIEKVLDAEALAALTQRVQQVESA